MQDWARQGKVASPCSTKSRHDVRSIFLLVVLATMSLAAFAQQPAANSVPWLVVSVLDEKNQPIAAATIEMRSGDKIISSASSDATGKVKLPIPPAGTYQLSITKQGFITTDTPLEITVGTPPDVDVVMSPADLSVQSVNVTAQGSNPVTETNNSSQSLPPEQAKNAPSRPATLTDALPLVPGIVRGPDGTVRIAGLGESHSAMVVNSVDVTDPSTGNFGLSVPIDSVQNIEVSDMPYLAQYGRFTGGVVEADTRRGGDKWDYSLNDPFPDFHIRSGHIEGVMDASPRLNLSGPLVANKVYFLEGFEYLYNEPEVRTLPYPENLTRSKAINSFTQLDALLSATQTLTFSLHLAPHSIDYAGLNYFDPQPVTPNANFHESTATVTHRWALGGGELDSTLAERGVTSIVAPQGADEMTLSPGGNSGNYYAQQSRKATRYEWIESWTPKTLKFAGEHTFKFGSVLGHSENTGQFFAKPVLLNNSTGQPIQRIDFTGGSPYDVADTEPALFAQDHWVLSPKLAVDTGIRLEGQTITGTTRAAPRTGFIWSPDAGHTTLRGGIGVFYDSVPLDVYAFNSYPQQTVTNYNPDGAPAGPPVTYLNLTDQTAQSKFPLIDRESRAGNFAPYSVKWNIAFERAIHRFVNVRLSYLQSHTQDLITLQPQVVQDVNALVLASSGWAQTRQMEFTSRIGKIASREFYFSYVRQYARGQVNDASSYLGNFSMPVVNPGLIGSLPSEIPNRFLLWGNYALPKKINVVPHLEYRNGFPYYPTDVFQQYVTDLAGAQSRFPRYFSFDLRTSKEFQVTSKHAVRLSMTIANLTGHFNPLQVYNNMADPQYGTFFGNYPRRFLFDFDFLY